MGVDIHFNICRYNRREHKWEEILLYKNKKNLEGNMELVDWFDGRNYEIFGILNGDEDEYFPKHSIDESLLPDGLKEKYLNVVNEFGYYDFFEANLADIKFYLTKHPKVRDWDSDEEDAWKDNPINYIVNLVDWAIEFYDGGWWMSTAADVKIVYWFDR